MSFDDAIKALSQDGLRFIKDGDTIGLGSGRTAAVFVRSLGAFVKETGISITCVPTSLQIKKIAEDGNLRLQSIDNIQALDAVFDGADQIDSDRFLIKGGGGALLRESILIGSAKRVIIMADKTKFVTRLDRAVPVEVHPLARKTTAAHLAGLGSAPKLRALDRGYPFITENGNIILDCNFGAIAKPRLLAQKISALPGVIETGIFTRKPDVIYKAHQNGRFETV